MTTGKPYRVKPAAPAQLAELRALGYTGSLSLVYSHEEAERLLIHLRAEKAAREAQEAKQKPLLLTAWQKGESQLDHHGYTVLEMPGTGGVCYEVIGGAEPYHVCIDQRKAEYGCSCPDGILRGDKRPCKHFLAVSVQIWRWAQESTDDYTEWLEHYGIMALYRAGHREKQEDGVYKPVEEAQSAPLALFGEDDGDAPGTSSAVGIL